VLRHEQDAEDAFQATFLVLAHRAAALDGGDSLAGWLHTVAHRLALRLREQSARRQECERQAAEARPAQTHDEPGAGELLPLIEEELRALPEKYRTPLVLCHLEGKTHEQAARELGWPTGSLWKRLERGRALLRGRLLRRGVAPSVGLLAAGWAGASSAAVPAVLADSTVRIAALVAAGTAPSAAVPAHVLALAQGALKATALHRGRIVLAALLLVGLFGGGAAALHRAFAEAPSPPPEQPPAPAEVLVAHRAPVPADPEPKETPAVADWTMFRGNAARSARGKGVIESPNRIWWQPTVAEKQIKEWVDKALAEEEKAGRVLVSAFYPITSGEFVVYRTHGGVCCLKSGTGKLQWMSLSEWSAERMWKDAQKQPALKRWFEGHQEAGRAAVVIENANLGMLSCDGDYVYLVDDLAFPPPGLKDDEPFGRWGAHLSHGVSANHLQAINLRTGKLVWELYPDLQSDDAAKDPLKDMRDAHFLGAPLPLDGKLYLLFQKGRDLRLASFDPSRLPPKGASWSDMGGALDWNESLVTLDGNLTPDSRRRLYGATLAYADDILVCPTNAGKVIGFDVKKRKVVWTHEYTTAKLGDALDSGWKAIGPVIHDGKVIVTAPDGEEVTCLWLRDGKVRWHTKRGDDAYVAGVFGNDVLLVGNGACRALGLADGKERWKVETGRPTGLGVAGDGPYYLPLANFGKSKDPEVCVLDVAKGAVMSHLKTGKKEAFGNLLLHDGRLISQTATDLSAFAEKETKPPEKAPEQPLEIEFTQFSGPPEGRKQVYDPETGVFHVHFRSGDVAARINKASAFEITKVADGFEKPVVFRLTGVPENPDRPLALLVDGGGHDLTPERCDKALFRVERKDGVTTVEFTKKGQALLKPGARVSFVEWTW
jgi:RNA polymerase sigma factor (sigma-70 family)